jgi:hypothetical protein
VGPALPVPLAPVPVVSVIMDTSGVA